MTENVASVSVCVVLTARTCSAIRLYKTLSSCLAVMPPGEKNYLHQLYVRLSECVCLIVEQRNTTLSGKYSL